MTSGVVRLYARGMGYSSHAVVSRGFSVELERRGLLAGVFPLESLNFDEETRFPGAGARIGLLTGPLGMLEHLRLNTLHERRIAMVAPNSSKVPGELLQKLHQVTTEILVPSAWAKQMMAPHYDKPITVVPHGLDFAYAVDATLAIERQGDYANGERRVLHFSTSAFERKGTVALLRVWQRLVEQRLIDTALARLLCVLDGGARRSLIAQWSGDLPSGVFIVERLDASHKKMAHMLQAAHVVCQPSRGEAFGMIPMQALACGVPVVATIESGHSEHLVGQTGPVPGLWPVVCHEDAPIDDGPGAMAPSYTDEALFEALSAAVVGPSWQEKNQQALANASAYAEQWDWQRVLAPWLGTLARKDQES